METSPHDGRAGRIIIADDIPHVRASLRLMFTTILGLEVVGEAADAAGLIALLATVEADIITVDRNIPGLEDPAQVEEIRRRAPHSRILLCSVFDCDAGQKPCYLKADFTISKSQGPDHWLYEMQRLLADKPPGIINVTIEKGGGMMQRHLRHAARRHARHERHLHRLSERIARVRRRFVCPEKAIEGTESRLS